MRRRDLFLAAFAPQPDDFGLRLYTHLQHVQELTLAYFGCIPNATELNDEQCKLYRANLDRAKYKRARESAVKFFDLKEKP